MSPQTCARSAPADLWLSSYMAEGTWLFGLRLLTRGLDYLGESNVIIRENQRIWIWLLLRLGEEATSQAMQAACNVGRGKDMVPPDDMLTLAHWLQNTVADLGASILRVICYGSDRNFIPCGDNILFIKAVSIEYHILGMLWHFMWNISLLGLLLGTQATEFISPWFCRREIHGHVWAGLF